MTPCARRVTGRGMMIRMKWITRENAKVDRMACPWLIRRFVDPDAEFLFVPRSEVEALAQQTGAIPFDAPGAKLGHVAGRCSFESILVEHGLTRDPALMRLAQMVHAADVADDIDTCPEARGLRAMAEGFSLLLGVRDHEKLALEMPVYDALYEWCRAQVDAAEA